MRALLRADWLRFRRRKDVWIIGIAVCIIGLVSFLAAYHAESTDPTWFTTDPAQVRAEILSYSDFSGMTQAEIDEQVELMVSSQLDQNEFQLQQWEEQQRIALQKYDLPQAVFTFVGSGFAGALALLLIAGLVVGDEFRFGTIRTSLLAAGSRRRFLAVRWITLFAMAVGLLAAQILIGLILAVGLRLAGAEVTPTIVPVDAGAAIGWLGANLLITMALVSLCVALTVLLRSNAMPLLLIILAGLIELFVSALPIFQPLQFLAGVPQAFLSTSIRTLLARLGAETHAVALAPNEIPWAAVELPLVAVAGIVAAWGVLFLLIADRRFRTMDVVE
jgi:hypothetical protein